MNLSINLKKKKIKIKTQGDGVTDFYDKEIPKVDSNHTCLAVISLDFDLKRDGSYYHQVFLKECKYIKKKVIRHIIDDLGSSSNDSDDSDEEQINSMRLMFFENVLREKIIFRKCIFEGAILKTSFFEGAISKMYFLMERFQKCLFRGSNFENVFLKGIF